MSKAEGKPEILFPGTDRCALENREHQHKEDMELYMLLCLKCKYEFLCI